jgi:hypothetical protein
MKNYTVHEPDEFLAMAGSGNGQDRNPPEGGVTLNDFYAYMPQHRYIFEPTREMWPASSVNARIAPIPILTRAGTPVLDEDGKPKQMSASTWLNQHRPVEQMTWVPGMPGSGIAKTAGLSRIGWSSAAMSRS